MRTVEQLKALLGKRVVILGERGVHATVLKFMVSMGGLPEVYCFWWNGQDVKQEWLPEAVVESVEG